ncbi:MAG TPA: hypothetical protein PK329_11210 [Myxococcota bacterium]|jgi:hypothetical protein|nr:MAG: hypothetical protein BWX66_01899 [Deltaproteobacteria bacterium ADurb.Bin058]HOE83513.1 hypothetical protein [Myxococcota bacterium]HON26293.1 hypothetical protein [Myxococcota bacterium]HOS63039.1 hypothetical protein [Myxococcota bacterium]HPC93062.1 hypothetical protein [Myxococcota bacterium]
MSGEEQDWIYMLLAAGPTGAALFYWYMYRFYRNTDKSHGFERETAIDAEEVECTDYKIGENNRTRQRSIRGENSKSFRDRVQRY